MNNLSSVNKYSYDIKYRPGSSDESVIKHSFENDIYLPVLKHINFSQDDVVFDIGAHIGAFSIMLNHVTEGILNIQCFEASKETCDILIQNIESNRLLNIVANHIALTGDNVDSLKLYHDTEHGNWGHSVVHDFGGKYEEVKNVQFDNFFNSLSVSRIKLAKFNCEGSEVSIVMNTPISQLQKIDNIVLLYHFDLVKEHSLGELKSRLKQSGLDLYDLKTEKDRGWLVGTRNVTSRYKTLKAKNMIYNRLGVLKRGVASLFNH